jgi:hypothetical protein
MKQKVYYKLRRLIPGIAKDTPLKELDLKLKEAQSNPYMVALMSEFGYKRVLAVAKTQVARGLFNPGERSSSSYASACQAVRISAESCVLGVDHLQQAPRCHKDDAHEPATLGSPLSDASLPTSTFETAISNFDLLLEAHLTISKAASATSAALPKLDSAETVESTRSVQMTGGPNQIDKVPQVVQNRARRRKIQLIDESGHYAEIYLEKFYQILKPHLKGLRYGTQRFLGR